MGDRSRNLRTPGLSSSTLRAFTGFSAHRASSGLRLSAPLWNRPVRSSRSYEGNMRTFVEPKNVETQVFAWGRIQWLSEPRVTGARQIAAGVVTLNPGQGHARHNHPGVEEILYVLEGEGVQMIQLGAEEQHRTV